MRSGDRTTAALIEEAGEIRRNVREIIGDLRQIEEDIDRDLAFLRWFRFLGYDARTLDFLAKLEMGEGIGQDQ